MIFLSPMFSLFFLIENNGFLIPLVSPKPDRKNRQTILRPRPLGPLVIFFLILIFGHPLTIAQESGGKSGPPPSPVEVARVEEREVTPQISLVGSAEPRLETVVASEAAGKVKGMLVSEGDRVKENQLLCEQDTTQLELRIQAAQARITEAAAIRAKAEREWERQKRLYEIGSVAAKAYDDARFNLDAARSNESRLKADLSALKDQLAKKRIKAPVAGYVVKRYCIVGQWLGEGEPVARLVVEDPIWVRIPVPERYISGIKPGLPAQVTFDAIPGRTFKGKVVAVIPQAEEAARTFPVRIQIPNPEGTIKAGMLGRATFVMGEAERVLLVHKDALVLSERGIRVYVVEGQSVRPVSVITGSAQDSLIEVRGDLSPGQFVVTRGNERLRPGQSIRILSKGQKGSHESD